MSYEAKQEIKSYNVFSSLRILNQKKALCKLHQGSESSYVLDHDNKVAVHGHWGINFPVFYKQMLLTLYYFT